MGGFSFEMPQFMDVSTALPFSQSVSYYLGACSRTENDNCVRLNPLTSRSQVEHSTTEPIGKAGMISRVGSYQIGY